MILCDARIPVWSHGATLPCQQPSGHRGAHQNKWGRAYLRWGHMPRCGAWRIGVTDPESIQVCVRGQGHPSPHTSFEPYEGRRIQWEGDAREVEFTGWDLGAQEDFEEALAKSLSVPGPHRLTVLPPGLPELTMLDPAELPRMEIRYPPRTRAQRKNRRAR